MARISAVSGSIEFRPATTVGWSTAAMNSPVQQGAELWAKSGRAEMQFDDGSVLRLGSGATSAIESMYSDSNGEFTELKVQNGLATLHMRSQAAEFQVDTPQCSVKAHGPGVIRIGINGDVCEIADESGNAEILTPHSHRAIRRGQMVDFRPRGGRGVSPVVAGESVQRPPENYSEPTQYAETTPAVYDEVVEQLPPPDNWDNWNTERDTYVFHENRYLPTDINICAGNLDDYGTWRDDPKYGEVWLPRAESADWQPYEQGNWDWVSPIGWTWVGSEPWGWAPYHYGTWYHADYGWAWCPGPAHQYWAPAVVDFCDTGNQVAWAPLAPWEVRYPSAINIGFSLGDWSLDFSIGQVGSYFPYNDSYCVARPWANSWVNSGWQYYDPTYINNTYYTAVYNNSGSWWGQSQFRPYNAYHNNGTVVASYSSFANGGRYTRLPSTQAAIWQHGRSFTGAPRGSQISGPINIRPNRTAFTPTHHYVQTAPPATITRRPVYQAAVPTRIAQNRVSAYRGAVATNRNFNRPGFNGRTAPGVAANTAIRPGMNVRPGFNGRNAAVAANGRPGTNMGPGTNGRNNAISRITAHNGNQNALNRLAQINARKNGLPNVQTTRTRNAMAVAHHAATNASAAAANRAAANRAAGRAIGRTVHNNTSAVTRSAASAAHSFAAGNRRVAATRTASPRASFNRTVPRTTPIRRNNNFSSYGHQLLPRTGHAANSGVRQYNGNSNFRPMPNGRNRFAPSTRTNTYRPVQSYRPNNSYRPAPRRAPSYSGRSTYQSAPSYMRRATPTPPRSFSGTSHYNTGNFGGRSMFHAAPRAYSGGNSYRPAPRPSFGGSSFRPAPRPSFGGSSYRPAPRSFGGGSYRPAPRSAPRPAPRPAPAPRGSNNRRPPR